MAGGSHVALKGPSVRLMDPSLSACERVFLWLERVLCCPEGPLVGREGPSVGVVSLVGTRAYCRLKWDPFRSERVSIVLKCSPVGLWGHMSAWHGSVRLRGRYVDLDPMSDSSESSVGHIVLFFGTGGSMSVLEDALSAQLVGQAKAG